MGRPDAAGLRDVCGVELYQRSGPKLPRMERRRFVKRENKRPPRRIPELKKLTLPPKDYQPSKAELAEEFDVPRMSRKQRREAFVRPFQLARDK